MLTNARKQTCFCLIFLMFVAFPLWPQNVLSNKGENNQNAPNENFEVTALPPRLVEYPLFNNEVDHFSVLIKSNTPLDKVQFRIVFPQESAEMPAEFFTNNTLWKKIDGAFYLTNIFGKPAEIPIVENYFKLDVNYRFKPAEYTRGRIEILFKSKVIKSIPIDFIAPLKTSYYWNLFVVEIKKGDNQKIAAGLILLVLLWFMYDILYRRRKQKSIPLCSTRAKFSTLIEENHILKLEETKNPFGCRLGGLKKKIRILYRNSTISIWISGKRYDFTDRDSVSLDINDVWKLRIEAQNYFGNDEKSHKNLVVLLLPV